jgi:hypothetical protein
MAGDIAEPIATPDPVKARRRNGVESGPAHPIAAKAATPIIAPDSQPPGICANPNPQPPIAAPASVTNSPRILRSVLRRCRNLTA